MYEKYAKWRSDYNNLRLNKDSILLDSFLLKTYEENIGNIFSFNIGSRYLDIHQNNKLKLYPLLPLMARQSDELKQQFGFSMLNQRLQGIIRNNVVRLADYPLLDVRKKITHAKTLNARFVILDFWFVACKPCVEDHQKMVKLFPQLKQKQVDFISISNDDSYKTWKAYLDKRKFIWKHYKKSSDSNNIIDQLGISTYPTYIQLDDKGKILYSTYSLEEMLAQLK